MREGSSGIGVAAAHKLVEAGAITPICGRDLGGRDAACREAKVNGCSFMAYPVNVADMTDSDRFVKQLMEDHGSVDFLINSA